MLTKYLERINKFFRRAYRYGNSSKIYSISKLNEERDEKLFSKIANDPEHVLYDLLPEKRYRSLRERKHPFILPKVKTELYKRSFSKKCLFNAFK